MAPYRPVDTNQSFPALEEQILERWKERDVFHESLRRRAGAPLYVFYEGPPTANGAPGSHHVLSRVFKDIFPRYKTMTGHHVPRKAGWDCHGLPVELEVERQLGIHSKHEIEALGIEEFNRRCRESVFSYVEEWNRLTERIAFWIDLDDAYVTLDNEYIESVWWALRRIWDEDLLYEGHKVVPYCPRCGTALSSHEVALGYHDVVDPSVYVTFPVTEPRGPLQDDDALLVWTTTPWTLVSNAAVAMDPDLTYVRARLGDRVYVLAEALVARVLGEDAEVQERFPGREIEGTAYDPPFGFIPGAEYGRRGHRVLPADFVSAEDGTGLVHTAIAFGEDDFRLGEQFGLKVINPVRPDGTYDERIGPYAGRFVKDADPDLVADLESRGRVFKRRAVRARLPALLALRHAAAATTRRPSGTSARRRAAKRCSRPTSRSSGTRSTSSTGASAKWLENNVDWALSRERYWGTPLPVWRCEEGHARCIGSIAELQELSGEVPDDLHRPYIDEVTMDCDQCGATMRRVPEVIDAWFDSGAMPFAQFHYPFENEELFEERFPADFICEALDQTRGWFYSLLAELDAAVRRRELSQRALPRPDPRPRRPEDVEEPRQRGRAVGRARHARRGRDALVLLHLAAALVGLPLLGRDGRRERAQVPADAVEHVQLLRPLRERRRLRARRRGARSPQRGRRSTAGCSRACRGRSPRCGRGSTPTTRRRPAVRSRRSSTISRTGTCAAAGAASGAVTRPTGRTSAAPTSPSTNRS